MSPCEFDTAWLRRGRTSCWLPLLILTKECSISKPQQLLIQGVDCMLLKSVLSSCRGLGYTDRPKAHLTSLHFTHHRWKQPAIPKSKKKKKKSGSLVGVIIWPLEWQINPIYPESWFMPGCGLIILLLHTHPPFSTLFQNLPSGVWSFTLTFGNTSHALWGVLWDPDVVWLRMEKVLNYVISAEGAIKSVLGDEVLKRHSSWPGLIDGLRWVIRRGGGYTAVIWSSFFLQELGVSSPFSSPPACCKLFYCSIASFTATEAGEGKTKREKEDVCACL